MSASLVPWSLDPDGHARVREDLASMAATVKIAVLSAIAETYIRAPDGNLADAANQLVDALAPALAEIRHQCAVAILHLDQAAERAQRKQNAAERAIERAEHEISKALAGLQVTALTADALSSAQTRWRPGRGTCGGFNPHGFFVYCLWGEDGDCPIYIGQSTNVLGRLGTHVNGKGGAIHRVTLLRCKSKRQMDETEARMIGHYQPRLNVAGIRVAAS